VLHAAGLPGQGLTQLKSAQTAAAVMAPKIQGTLVLDRALAGLDLDFMILASSVAAVSGGGPGQIEYCAANAFLDAFAHHRRGARGLTVAINFGEWQWDAWSEGLKGFQPEIREAFVQHRRKFGITFEEGMEAIRRVLSLDLAQIILLPEDAVAMVAGSNACSVTHLTQVVSQDRARRQNRYPRPALPTSFVAAGNEIEDKIVEAWKEVLGIEEIGIHDNFFDLGGTSLSALQLVAGLRRTLSTPLSPIVIFECPTVHALAKRLSPRTDQTAETTRKLNLVYKKATRQRQNRGTDVAIIGMSGRFPGARTIQQFWDNLVNGTECVHVMTDEELQKAGVPRHVFESPNYVRSRPIVDDPDMFDAGFFGYSPFEAQITDPQRRMLLEVAWEAMEIAGYDSQRYAGSVGVFAGQTNINYAASLKKDPRTIALLDSPEMSLANESDSLATAISYKLDLHGPSYCIQTYCSTSLVAVHLACQSLLAGECDMALAGGVSLRVPQKRGYLYEEGGLQSPDGRSRTFSADAGGTVFGEGVGMVILKRLEDAIAEGDAICAVIKGTATNNDGATKAGFTAPSVAGQAEAITMALAKANVDARTIDYVEASGTATALGDSIEVSALTQAFGAFTQDKHFCVIGSIKPNVGHPDRAAGILGLIKTVEALNHRLIPPTLFFKTPNPEINFAASPFYVSTRVEPWEKKDGPRRAGINSFGTGGTNAHAILEEAPVRQASAPGRASKLIVLSARTASALELMTSNLSEFLKNNPRVNLNDAAFTLQVGRRRFPHRRALVCSQHGDLLEALRGERPESVLTHLAGTRSYSTGFIFPDAESAYEAKLPQLYFKESVFRDEMDRCNHLFKPILGIDLRTVTASSVDRNKIAGVRYALSFANGYATARLLMSWGLAPQAMIGRGTGAILAGTLSGCFSLRDAAHLTCALGQLAASRVSRDPTERECVSVLELLRQTDLQAPAIACICNATGDWMTTEDAGNPEIWVEQITRRDSGPHGFQKFLEMKDCAFIEVGPGNEQQRDQRVVPTVRSEGTTGTTDEAFLLAALARLYVTGVDIDWSSFYAHESRRRVPLPTYPFERQRYWLDVDNESLPTGAPAAGAVRGLLRGASEIYTPSWTRSSPMRSRRPEQFSWVVFTDETSSLSNHIVATLRSEGADPLCVPMEHGARAPHFQGTFDRDLLAKILGASWAERRKPTRILYLWSLLSQPPSKQTHQNSLDAILSAAALAQMVDQAIESSYKDQDCLVLRVINCAMRVTGYEIILAERALLSVRNESASDGANIRRRSVDVNPPSHGTELEKDLAASLLTEAMASSMGSGSVAIREGIWRWLPQSELVHMDAGDDHLPAITEAGNYLIAGDTTSMGIILAYQVACAGAASLTITSPYELPPRERWDTLVDGSAETNEVAQWLWQIRAIEEMGCNVHVLAIDPDKTERLSQAVRQLHGRDISGVFYITDATASSKVDAQKVLRSRAHRLASLHDALTDVSVGFVVMLAALDCMTGDTYTEELALFGAYQDALAISGSSRKRRIASIVCHSSHGVGGSPTKGVHWYELADNIWQILGVGLTQASLTIHDPRKSRLSKNAGTVIGVSLHDRPLLDIRYIEPRNELERKLAAIWGESLGIRHVGIHDNFFALGGDSLLGVRVFARINRDMKLSLQLRSIFDFPTVAEQAEMIQTINWCTHETGSADEAGVVEELI
jgi:acyl transferase domain-containing protein/acyl carrier protein